MKHIMVDIETYGMPPNGALLQIGACVFDPDRVQTIEELVADSFLVSINRKYYDGLKEDSAWKVEERTVQWWSEQSIDAQAALNLELVSSPREGLQKFATWVLGAGFRFEPKNSPDVGQVWANPPTFDLAILNHGFDVCDMRRPWHFRQEKDARTLMWLSMGYMGMYAKVKKETEGLVGHRGDHDAIKQAIYVQHALSKAGPWARR